MARRIFSINEGLITFIGDKGEEVAGSSEDCRMVGGKYTGTACVLPNVGHNDNLTNNRNILGQGNILDSEALNNNIIGDKNTIGNVENTHTIGKFAHTTRQGEYTQAFTTATGRTQRSVLMFEGTTTNDVLTEIFLGGQSNKRFIVDETKDCLIGFESYVLAYRVDSGRPGECMNLFDHATFRVLNGVLSQISTTSTKTTNVNHSSRWGTTYTATSDTPDYIKVECKGSSEATVHWSVILHVFELKTDLI